MSADWQYEASAEGDQIIVEPSYQEDRAAFVEVWDGSAAAIWLSPEDTIRLRDHLTRIIDGEVTYE